MIIFRLLFAICECKGGLAELLLFMLMVIS